MSYPNIINEINTLENKHNTDISNVNNNLALQIQTIKSSYLSLTGDTMTGSIRFNGKCCIWLDTEDYDYLCARLSENQDKSVILTSGSNSNTGGSIFLRGMNHSTNGGEVILQSVATDGTKKYCSFMPSGELLINGQIATTLIESKSDGSQWYWKFSNRMLYVGGWTTVGGAVNISFCHPFLHNPNWIGVTAQHGISGSAVVTSEVMSSSATGFKLSQRLGGLYAPSVDNNCRTNWLAIGWW